jgi:hemerythrin superfamily protein
MATELHEFLSRDHERLDALLVRCLETVDPEAYDEFRRGLLRHIAIEERVLFPLLRESRAMTEVEQQLHRDHAALAALLVPPPSPAEIAQIAAILEPHNQLEERDGGMYERVEALSGTELTALMTRVHAVTPVRVAPHADTRIVRSSIAQLVREAEEGRRNLRGYRATPLRRDQPGG